MKLCVTRPVRVLLLVLATAASVTPLGWAQAPQTDLPFDPSVLRGTLSNGLVYYVRDNPDPRGRAHLLLVVRAGSALEEEHERGLAHFVEHMAVHGTARFSGKELTDFLKLSASESDPDLDTRFDETVFRIEIPTDDAAVVKTAFEILSDWAYGISFDPTALERERRVVLRELRTNHGVVPRIFARHVPKLFGASRYAERLPMGQRRVLATASAAHLRAFYERWYRPDLMAVIAVGDFDPDQIADTIRHQFAPPPEGAAQPARARRPEPPTSRPRFTVPSHAAPRVGIAMDSDMGATWVTLYRKQPAETGQAVAAFRRRFMVDVLVQRMLAGRLSKRTQTADPPYLSVLVGRLSLVADTASWTVFAQVDQDGVGRGVETLIEEIQHVLRHGFTPAELEREKAVRLREVEDIEQGRVPLPSRLFAEEYVRHFLYAEPVPGITAEYELHRRLLPEISLAEVNGVPAAWRDLRDTVLFVLGPEGVASGPEAEQALLAKLTGAGAPEVPSESRARDVPLLVPRPEPGSITAERRIEAIDAVRWTLSNGVTVIAKQTEFRSDEVLVAASSPGGASVVADADYIPALTAAEIVRGSGAGPYDWEALEELLSGNTAEVRPYIRDLHEGFTGSSAPWDLEALFQLITLYATEPRFDPAYYMLYLLALHNRCNIPPTSQIIALLHDDTLHSATTGNHFRRTTLSCDRLQRLNLERSVAVYADRFRDFSDFTFVVVGAFDWDQLRTLTTTYLATLPAAGRVEQWRDAGIAAPAGVVDRVLRQQTDAGSVTRLVFAWEMAWSRMETATLLVLSEMLEVRLQERLRNELGAASWVYARSTVTSLLPDPQYWVFVTLGSEPHRADEMLEEVFGAIDWLIAGSEQSDLEQAKEYLREVNVGSRLTNDFWLKQIDVVVKRGEPFSAITGMDQLLEAITLEQVTAAARSYLRRDRYVRVVLLPEAATEAE